MLHGYASLVNTVYSARFCTLTAQIGQVMTNMNNPMRSKMNYVDVPRAKYPRGFIDARECAESILKTFGIKKLTFRS